MSAVLFLLDENMPRALVAALHRREPTLDVRRVGQSGMPATGTKDPYLLRFCEQSGRPLVSRTVHPCRNTLPTIWLQEATPPVFSWRQSAAR